jgi:HSP20 family protein
MRNFILPGVTLLVGALLGSAGVYSVTQKNESRITASSADRPWITPRASDFFTTPDPFQHMQKMREEMDEFMKSSFHSFGSLDLNSGGVASIETDEDKRYVYYRIKFDGIDKESLRVEVQNGHVSIFGEKRVEQQKVHSSFTFSRTLPVPSGVDEDRVSIESKNDFLELKFPKVNASLKPLSGESEV